MRKPRRSLLVKRGKVESLLGRTLRKPLQDEIYEEPQHVDVVDHVGPLCVADVASLPAGSSPGRCARGMPKTVSTGTQVARKWTRGPTLMCRCGQNIGFELRREAESPAHLFAALAQRLVQMPRVMCCDTACRTQRNALRRVPWLMISEAVSFFTDRFH